MNGDTLEERARTSIPRYNMHSITRERLGGLNARLSRGLMSRSLRYRVHTGIFNPVKKHISIVNDIDILTSRQLVNVITN